MARLSARTAVGSGQSAPALQRTSNGVRALAAVGRADAVRIRELPLFGCLDLRMAALNDAARQAVAQVIGAALPAPNTWAAASGMQILWQAYDEWLIIGKDGTQGAIGPSLRSALAAMHCAVTDVSDLRVAFELQGPRARDVLQKGCALDLHSRVFDPRSCATTALARVRVTLTQTGAEPTYQVLVERSYAVYLWTWLTDAAWEYV